MSSGLNSYPGKPLLGMRTRRTTCSSAFKVVTTGIALENGVTSMDRNWDVETEFVPPQTSDPIQNYGRSACGGTMAEVFYRSCNIPFARMATELGPQRMTDGVRSWGIGEKLPIDLPGGGEQLLRQRAAVRRPSSGPAAVVGHRRRSGNDLMVPPHMCMIAATVANGGGDEDTVIAATLKHDGTVITPTDQVWKQPITAATAATTG